MIFSNNQQADICMILEGTYPYVPGGVSHWVHDLISDLPEIKFHLVTIVASEENLKLQYTLPDNIIGVSHLVVQKLPSGSNSISRSKKFFADLAESMQPIHSDPGLEDLAHILEVLGPHKNKLGEQLLLNSKEAWEMLIQMYQAKFSKSSFLDFFWSWRSIMSGLYSILLAPLPPARIYHAVSTGYAGLLAARAKLETQKPVVLTEHGIYTNERRIEISMSDWFHLRPTGWLNINNFKKDLKDFWIDSFINYSRFCYRASDKIITLFPENQAMQRADGANPEKQEIIPNGVDYQFYSKIVRQNNIRPTIALIGRVVPIKDVKSFIMACDILKKSIPDLLAYIIGPTNEDKAYFKECLEMVNFLKLSETIKFTGRVKIMDYVDQIQVNVLTSISEGQPLVILELGAVGIPSVATNVGACAELILGRDSESPPLKPGGAITPLSNPAATAQEIAELLNHRDWYLQCSQACKERVFRYYNKPDLIKRYRDLYQSYLEIHQPLETVEV